MRTRNKLQIEAEKKLHEFDIELKNTRNQITQIRHRMIGLAAIPLVVIPLAIGYFLFKKRSRTEITSPKTDIEVVQENPPHFSWISSLAKEAFLIFAGRMLSSFLQKR